MSGRHLEPAPSAILDRQTHRPWRRGCYLGTSPPAHSHGQDGGQFVSKSPSVWSFHHSSKLRQSTHRSANSCWKCFVAYLSAERDWNTSWCELTRRFRVRLAGLGLPGGVLKSLNSAPISIRAGEATHLLTVLLKWYPFDIPMERQPQNWMLSPRGYQAF